MWIVRCLQHYTNMMWPQFLVPWDAACWASPHREHVCSPWPGAGGSVQWPQMLLHDTDGLVLIGNELVVFFHSQIDRALQPAWVSRWTDVCSVAVNSAMEAEGRLFTFALLQRVIVWGIACGWGAAGVGAGGLVCGVGLKQTVIWRYA